MYVNIPNYRDAASFHISGAVTHNELRSEKYEEFSGEGVLRELFKRWTDLSLLALDGTRSNEHCAQCALNQATPLRCSGHARYSHLLRLYCIVIPVTGCSSLFS